MVRVQGRVAPGYESVAAEFERNLTERGELGAAFAAVRDGEVVVDLWGGVGNPDAAREWQRDTLTPVFSGTKGFVAVCILMLIERGALDLDEPVSRYWPEFAAAGKQGTLVRNVVSHTACLPGILHPLEIEDLVDDARMAALLAAQAPFWDDGRICYHSLTYGWLCGELVRRVDGRSVGQFFADEVAAPLGLDLWIGLPSEFEQRVARLELAADWGANRPVFDDEALAANPLLRAVYENPWLWDRESLPWNSRAYHAAEIPGAGAIGTARSISRLYGCLARGGALDGVRLLSEDTVRRAGQVLASGTDAFGDVPLAFGIGFELQNELMPFGPPSSAFGHGGAGGSVHGAWPHERVGFSYAMNLMRDVLVDARATALLGALHQAVSELAPAQNPARGWVGLTRSVIQ